MPPATASATPWPAGPTPATCSGSPSRSPSLASASTTALPSSATDRESSAAAGAWSRIRQPNGAAGPATPDTTPRTENACPPGSRSSYVTGDWQGTNGAPLRLHSNPRAGASAATESPRPAAAAPDPPKVNVADRSVVSAGGCSPITGAPGGDAEIKSDAESEAPSGSVTVNVTAWTPGPKVCVGLGASEVSPSPKLQWC